MKNFLFQAKFWVLILTSSFLLDLKAIDTGTSIRPEFRGQKKSLTTWGNLPTESFLSFSKWKVASDLQDQVPEWEQSLRERNYKELAGRIFQCVGICRVDRGEGFFNGTHRTGIYEGDEIQTIGDSYAWIFLMDGTMVRMSPQSSITINEFNVGEKENFINARINTGNVLWLSRLESSLEEWNSRETDVLFFPYAEYDSLPVREVKEYKEDDLLELTMPKETYLYHYKNLNQKIAQNNSMTRKKQTYAFIVLPNGTLMGKSPNLEVVTLLGGKSYLKKRSFITLGLSKENMIDEPQELYLQMRGYDNKELTTVKEDEWISIEEKGRNLAEADSLSWLNMGEFITKRIPSILLGREIFLSRYSAFAFREKYDPLILAKEDGYRLWGKMRDKEEDPKSDLDERVEFLKEYFRRIETTNLLASGKYKERLEARGEKAQMTEYGRFYFITALNTYYKYGELQLDNSSDSQTGEVLNSTKKLLWKKMHGIK